MSGRPLRSFCDVKRRLRRFTHLARATLPLWVWLAACLPSCGARTELATLSARSQEPAHTSTHVESPPAPSPTLFVETEAPIVLTPKACTSNDAATSPPNGWVAVPAPIEGTSKGACGNGRQEEYESCDDGNRIAADGCDADCRIEPFYVCTTGGAPCVRLHVCGDGVLQPGEACDDGNLQSHDGCSPSCQVEFTFDALGGGNADCTANGPCAEQVEDHCGDGLVQHELGEQCDLATHNTSAHGGCTQRCTLAARCGDLVVQSCGQETCDDGNRVGGDGCSADCKLEQRWVR